VSVQLARRGDLVRGDFSGTAPIATSDQESCYEQQEMAGYWEIDVSDPERQDVVTCVVNGSETTDHNFMRAVLDTAWRSIGPESPNWTDGGALRLLQVAPGADVDAEAVVGLLRATRPGTAPVLPSSQEDFRTQ
jgi:hypothetical protein